MVYGLSLQIKYIVVLISKSITHHTPKQSSAVTKVDEPVQWSRYRGRRGGGISQISYISY